MYKDYYPYIKYDLPNGVTFLLTPRPDAYDLTAVNDFIEKWNPKVRFQFTDNLVDFNGGPHTHWYSWIPGRKLPTELVWSAVNLIIQQASTPGVIWMHCDSSSMRAPTFFGHYLAVTYSRDIIEKIEDSATWSDGRYHSLPTYYSDTSLKLDPGMKELIEIWKNEGYEKAYDHIMWKKFLE